MNRALSPLFFFIFSVSLSAQTGGEERNAFLHRSNAAANAYRSAKQQEYGAFLRRSWGSAAESAPKEDPFKRGDAGRPTGDNLTENTVPVEEPIVVRKTKPSEEVISGGKFPFNFYGRTYRVRYNRSADLTLPSVSESDVASAWDALSARLTDLVDDCLAIRKREDLCDWAYLQLVDSLSISVYPELENERELLFGFMMGKSGYNVRFGRSGDVLTCLYGARQIIYAQSYFPEEDAYFFRHRPGQGSLEISETVPEGTRLLDFRLTRCPAFQLGPELVRHIKTGSIELDYRIPKSQLDFYASYPHTEIHIKADAPVSDAVRSTVYPALSAAIAGKGQVDAANTILRFVQGLMEYQTDMRRWGYEKWSFPEESFYYLCGDCDDHAILFSRLIRDLLGLDVLLVECEVDGAPHETTAVRFTEPLEGDTILYDSETYYCCEPTSNVAKVGQRQWNNYVVTHIDKVK